MSKSERRIVPDGNDECRTGSTQDDTGGNREMKHITGDELREVTASLLALAAEDFDRLGNSPTYAIVIDPHGERQLLMPAFMRNVQDKECFTDDIAQAVTGCDAVAVVVVAESWINDIPLDVVTQSSRRPNRWEALQATVETADGMSLHLWPILRNGNSVRLGECGVECGDNYDGRLTGLLRRPKPELN